MKAGTLTFVKVVLVISIMLNLAGGFWIWWSVHLALVAPWSPHIQEIVSQAASQDIARIAVTNEATTKELVVYASGAGIPVSLGEYVLLWRVSDDKCAAVQITERSPDSMLYNWYYCGNGKRIVTQGSGKVYEEVTFVTQANGVRTRVAQSHSTIEFEGFMLIWFSAAGGRDALLFDSSKVRASLWRGKGVRDIDFSSNSLRWCTNTIGCAVLASYMEGQELNPLTSQLLTNETIVRVKQAGQ